MQWTVLDPDCIESTTIEVANDLVHLPAGNLGILRQIRESNGTARFCRREQLDTTKMVQPSTGILVSCTLSRTWPISPDPAASDRAGVGDPALACLTISGRAAAVAHMETAADSAAAAINAANRAEASLSDLFLHDSPLGQLVLLAKVASKLGHSLVGALML